MLAVPFGPGTDIWRSCRYIGALFLALVALPGSIRRFVSCEVGACLSVKTHISLHGAVCQCTLS